MIKKEYKLVSYELDEFEIEYNGDDMPAELLLEKIRGHIKKHGKSYLLSYSIRLYADDYSMILQGKKLESDGQYEYRLQREAQYAEDKKQRELRTLRELQVKYPEEV